jgi:DNA sulfur modification protein DndD
VTDEESTLKRNEDSWVQEIKYNERKISEHNGTLLNIDSKIKEAESTLQREQEFKLVVENKQKLESKLERNESVLDSRINAGISLQSRAVLYIEILKHKEIFEKFMSKKGADEEIFTNLHRDVIESILKKGYCICGRPIEEHSKEMNKLLSLATLPNDNTVYLQGIESLFNRAQELPDILKQIRVIRGEISGLQSETRQLNIEYEKALKAVDNAQRENGSIDSGMNLASLRDLKYSAERSIRDLKNRNEKLNTNIKEVSSRLRTMRLNDQKNKKTQLVIDQLCKVADDLSNELKLKRITTQSTIERHLNESISELMENGLSATLSLDYELSIHKNVDNENVDETAVLSTGQSVMVSLSFLSALLKAVSEELPDKKSAVVMDAALSNVDERHIRLASDNVLTQFDQLIFMSFKRQLRRELFDGIHENVKMAYELSKDSSNNVILKELPLGSLKEYIERRDADGL